MKFLYGANMYFKRYEHIAREVEGLSVLDVGCGDCYLANYLPKNKYQGIDINRAFLGSARKKGLKVKYVDVIKQEIPEAECIIISGILHQLYPHHEEVLKKALKVTTKKLIICEPTTHLASSNNIFLKKIARMINNPGYGSPKKRLSKNELFELYKNYNVDKLYEVGRDSIAIFKGKKK
tara:strand:+ start:4983 stop:5519 length:537 start_codon:yes stop_codon:yes gene_type:complete